MMKQENKEKENQTIPEAEEPVSAEGQNRRDPSEVAGSGSVKKRNLPPADEQEAPEAEVSGGIDQAEDDLRSAADPETP